MKVPRNISGNELISYLLSIGFRKVRQTGSHVRLVAEINGMTQTITVPLHHPLKIGTLSNIVKDVAEKTGRDWMDIMKEL